MGRRRDRLITIKRENYCLKQLWNTVENERETTINE